jgi:hypothetical protein
MGLRGTPILAVCLLLLAFVGAIAAADALSRRGRPGAPPRGDPGSAAGPSSSVPAGEGDLFVDATEGAGLAFLHRLGDGRMDCVVEAAGAGGAVLDYDGDGRMDLYLVQSGWVEGVSRGERPADPPRNRLFRNRGDGTFEDVTERAGVACGRCGVAAAAGDYDGDGHVDLYVVNVGPNVLYRNRGDGTFEDATERAGVGDPRCGVGAAFLDADGDGRPDLFVANYVDFDPAYRLYFPPDGFPGPLAYEPEPSVLYRNRGDGTFEDVSERSGIRAGAGRAMGVAAADFDGDGRTDLFVANDATANALLRNEGNGRFRDDALSAGVAYGMQGEATAAMCGVVGDADGDGRPDLFVSDGAYGSLFRNLGGGRFEDRVFSSGLAAPRAHSPAWGSAWIDFDADGDEDLFVVSGDLHHEIGREDFLFENRGSGTFADASARGGAWFRAALNGRACLPADFDDDGRVDVVVTNLLDRAVLLRNRAPAGAWLTVSLRGLPPATGGLGAKVSVTAGGRTRTKECGAASVYLGQGDPRLHFGLGGAERVERVEVRWASGARTVLEGVEARRVLVVREEAVR